MAVTTKNIIPAVLVAAAQTTQYTAVGIRTIIDKLTAYNSSGAAVDLTINAIPAAGAASAANVLVKKTLQAGETYTFPEVVGHTLEVGSFISTLATTGNVLALRASGREVS